MTDGQLLERFVARHDEVAFEAIVVRHGPMVLDVCRNVLRHPHDAEDAFQATFLTLARNAGSIRKRDSLSSWLYGVALRTSRRSRAGAARRRQREARVAELTATEGAEAVGPERLDLPPVLHEELDRLPEKYRAPLVMCYLEGQTHEEAAQRLSWPVGTVKGRLSRARDLMRERLTRRGLALPALLMIPLWPRDAAAAEVPERLVEATVRAAVRVASGEATVAEAASPRVAELVEGGWTLTRPAATAALLALIAAALIVSLTTQRPAIGAIARRPLSILPAAALHDASSPPAPGACH